MFELKTMQDGIIIRSLFSYILTIWKSLEERKGKKGKKIVVAYFLNQFVIYRAV